MTCECVENANTNNSSLPDELPVKIKCHEEAIVTPYDLNLLGDIV